MQYDTINVRFLPLGFLNHIFFSLAHSAVRIQCIIRWTYHIHVTRVFVRSVGLRVNRRLLVVQFWGSQKLHMDFWLCKQRRGSMPLTPMLCTEQRYLVSFSVLPKLEHHYRKPFHWPYWNRLPLPVLGSSSHTEEFPRRTMFSVPVCHNLFHSIFWEVHSMLCLSIRPTQVCVIKYQPISIPPLEQPIICVGTFA